jgi:hypothetical protein
MTQKARNLASAVIVMAASVFWFIEGGSFRELSRIFPQVLAVIVFVLAGILTVLTILGHGPVIRLAEGDAGERHMRSGTLLVAIVIWTALIPLIGLLAASVIGVVGIGFMTFRAHEGTIRAIIIAVVFVGIFYLLFAILLDVPFPRGMLF